MTTPSQWILATSLAWCVLVPWPCTSARAATIYVSYAAGSPPAAVFGPTDFGQGWIPFYLNGNERGIANVDGTQRNVWRIDDPTPALPNPHYLFGIGGQNTTTSKLALRDGWRLATYARFLDVPTYRNDGPSMGLTAYMGNIEYDLMLNVNASGDLQATLYAETPVTFPLTTGGVGAYDFHNFELRNAGGTSVVQVYFDGKLVNPSYSWNGRPFTHENTVQWGNSSRAGAARGAMDFNYVAFTIGPFNSMLGDFDANSKVDGRDFLWWQKSIGSTQSPEMDLSANGVVDVDDYHLWSTRFGSTAAVDPTNVPEPPAAAIAAALLAIVGPWRPFVRRPMGGA